MNFSSTDDLIISKCRKLFLEKLKDYGVSWKFFHNYSIIDQILMKIVRIKNIQSKGYQKIKEEKIIDTYIDIINYLIIILIKFEICSTSHFHNKISNNDVILIYNKKWNKIKNYIDCMDKTFIQFSINNVLKNIFFLKKKKEKILFKELEQFCFKILVEIIFLLKQNL
ncbi:nucleotide modification associated domain-containing protein [Blattabacterium cuenoti]|uniref:nucleotide modification associated domain-containing protein n=1 Tax=Blattabacterium cuenoti TaxID=1653831 RepID=UPI00311F3150